MENKLHCNLKNVFVDYNKLSNKQRAFFSQLETRSFSTKEKKTAVLYRCQFSIRKILLSIAEIHIGYVF